MTALRQVSEGQLLKYTNMVKGWQTRWFVLDPHSGTLDYFMVIYIYLKKEAFKTCIVHAHQTESEKKQRPRGSLHLAGAIVVPSEEDSYTFSVNTANDESFKLRAVDARERQSWVNRLRVVAQAHTQVIAEVHKSKMHAQLHNLKNHSFLEQPSALQRSFTICRW